jgi:hypothetical protein
VPFADPVGCSLPNTDAQEGALETLQQAVRQTEEFQRTVGRNELNCVRAGEMKAAGFVGWIYDHFRTRAAALRRDAWGGCCGEIEL